MKLPPPPPGFPFVPPPGFDGRLWAATLILFVILVGAAGWKVLSYSYDAFEQAVTTTTVPLAPRPVTPP